VYVQSLRTFGRIREPRILDPTSGSIVESVNQFTARFRTGINA
jgi:hypothetical protein